MKGMFLSRAPEALQPLVLQTSAFEYYKKLFPQPVLDLKILLDPGASTSLPVKEIRAAVSAKGVVWGRRWLFCCHADGFGMTV